MSCSKPLPPFTFDLLCYLNRDQIERFSIICRPLKNLIDRYFQAKPCRVFDGLNIRGGSYVLVHNQVQWHPNRDDYAAQKFLDGRKCSIDHWNGPTYYSFAEMRPYLGANVRIKLISISVAGRITYNPEHVEEMESIAYLWLNGKISIAHANSASNSRIGADDLQPILNSPIVLQCRELQMDNAYFSFKDYKVLYAVKVIKIFHNVEDEIDLWQQYWQHFFEQQGVKPIVFFHFLRRENVDKLLDLLHKSFSSAISRNAFKIVFIQPNEQLTEFRETNYNSRERLELKEGLPLEYQNAPIEILINYTLERSSI